MKRMAFWLRVAVLFLVRSGRVTLVLALMIFTAVTALVFLSALATGVNDAMIRNSLGLYTGHISGENLPPALTPETLRVDGVIGVLRRCAMPGMLSAGRRLVPVTLVAVAPAAEAAMTGVPRKVIDGHYLAPASDQILLSAYLAEQLGVTTGSSLFFVDGRARREEGFTVCGIYRTEVDRLDYGVAFVAERACDVDHGAHVSSPLAATARSHSESSPMDRLLRFADPTRARLSSTTMILACTITALNGSLAIRG